MPISPTEARLIAIQVRVTELQVGDQVGPSDVLQPITYTVVGVPERTEVQRRDPVALLIRTPLGVESTLATAAATRVWVRRYVSRVTGLREADGSVDRTDSTVLLRTLLDSDVLTVVDVSSLRLRARDNLTFVAG